jgi:hypothetical protein
MGLINNIFNRLGGKPSVKKAQAINKDARILQLQRLRQNVATWREAINEMERDYYPHRVKVQNLFNDTIQNGHVFACMEARKDLTLLRDYRISVKDKDLEDLTLQFKEAKWFRELMSHILDAKFYGYSLVALGDLEGGRFPGISTVPRWLVSPDRLNVVTFQYNIHGASFLEPPYDDWHIWATTPSENGYSRCGYGLLYKVGLYEVITRINLGFNTTASEMFGMPFRAAFTDSREQEYRDDLARMLSEMGSAGWGIFDKEDKLEFIQANGGTGSGFLIFENLEKRCEAKISKVILGHADALDSVPGKLGMQNEDSPAAKALKAKQSTDGADMESVINEQVFPKLRKLGFAIPEDARFQFANDEEKHIARKREDESNQVTATIAKTMKDAGLQMDAEYFQERTGIPAVEIKQTEPTMPPAKGFKSIENKLREFYS